MSEPVENGADSGLGETLVKLSDLDLSDRDRAILENVLSDTENGV